MSETIDFTGATIDDFAKPGAVAAPVDPTPAATTPADPAPSVTPPVTPSPEPTPEPAKPEPTEYKWKDDFIKGVVEFYEKTGDITPYLQAKTVDFAKMSDEDILRRSLREQYSELSDKAFDKLYRMQVTDKFKLDEEEFSEDEVQLGRELLKIEANKARQSYAEWQKNFSAPSPVADTAVDQEAEKMMQQFVDSVKANQTTQRILADKKISIKTSDGEFNFELQAPESIVDMTLDNDKFFAQFVAPEGQVDYDRWYKAAAYSQNPELFEKALINYGKTLGRLEVTKDIKNPSDPGSGGVPSETSGDFASGLLQAFATRGVKK
jgi:hypothetical protein